MDHGSNALMVKSLVQDRNETQISYTKPMDSFGALPQASQIKEFLVKHFTQLATWARRQSWWRIERSAIIRGGKYSKIIPPTLSPPDAAESVQNR